MWGPWSQTPYSRPTNDSLIIDAIALGEAEGEGTSEVYNIIYSLSTGNGIGNATVESFVFVTTKAIGSGIGGTNIQCYSFTPISAIGHGIGIGQLRFIRTKSVSVKGNLTSTTLAGSRSDVSLKGKREQTRVGEMLRR